METTDLYDGLAFRIAGPRFQLEADGRRFTPDGMTAHGDGVWRDGDVEVRLLLSQAPDGSRELVLEADGVDHVHEVCLLGGEVEPAPAGSHNHVWFNVAGMQESTVLLLRRVDVGVFACYANPFGSAEVDGARVRLSYRPAMDVDGHFRSDPLVVGPTVLEGRLVQREALPGRDIADGAVAGYMDTLAPATTKALDVGEIRAIRSAVAARVRWEPAAGRSAHWDWSQNLFLLDIGDGRTRVIYDRLTVLCEELGVQTLLIAPGSPETAAEGMDAYAAGEGPWQVIMWLGQGVDVGTGRWKPGADLGPVAEVLEQARARNLRPVAYTNPQYLWLREDRWRLVRDPDPADPDVYLTCLGDSDVYQLTCLAVPEARRLLVDTARRFADTYDLDGYSFDFVFWLPCHASDHGHEPGPDSRYAQWDGYRRLMAELRRAMPNAWLETLIGGMELLPWGAADVTHPHPNTADNQPQWVAAWPDLSLDRAAANYQRRAAFWFRNFAFLPSYKVPGQVGHQANRMHLFSPERGWDWEGARYNLLSAVASGPSSLSVCFLPCWDEAEWEGVRQKEVAFFRRWLDFAREHEHVLARLEDLFEEPRPGAVDGTIALRDDGTGFVFLTNPDYREHSARAPLDDGFVLRELHPQPGRLWEDQVLVEPHTVTVLEVLPAADVPLPAVFGVAGEAQVDDRTAEASGLPAASIPVPPVGWAGQVETGVELKRAEGTPGSVGVAAIRLATGELRAVTVRFADDGVTPTLGPWRDESDEEVELAALDGGAVRVTASWVPGEALPALLATLAPPTDPEGDEKLNPWSDPSRLRMFPSLLDPKTADVRMWVDGDEVGLQKAYLGTYEDVRSPQTGDNNLLGYYADLTDRLRSTEDLSRPWEIRLELTLQWAGQLTGVHVAHLPRRTTTQFDVLA